MMRRPAIKFTQVFINNEFVDAVSGKQFATCDPCNEQLIAMVSEGAKEDVDRAVAAARAAFTIGAPWRTMDASRRGKLMHRLTELMARDREYIAELDTVDNGKPLASARCDVDQSIDCIQYFAGWADKIHGDTIPADGSVLSITKREPVGVVGQIIPWNYPLAMLAWKWGPALAAGCTIVIKPAEQTPLSALYMGALAREAGFPAGVINVVPGFGETAGAALAAHPDVNKIAFTGSTAVGKLVAQAAAASNLKRVSLELGGKSPLVIFADAAESLGLDRAVDIAHTAIFDNHGQNCSAGSRTFVQADIYDAFVEKAAAKAAAIKVGDPWTDGVDQGPQVSREQFDHVMRLIEAGVRQGATLKTGGQRHGEQGYFVQPTVFADVTDDMDIAQQEIFGPVQSILKFTTLEEVIARANSTSYGLGSGILTRDIGKAMTFAQSIEAGSVWINCYDHINAQTPFGGFKQSGQGRELGPEGVKEYLETKTITMALDQKNS